MNFFDMGFGEILLILIVALIIWGPDKIPHIARTMGRYVSMMRKMSQDLTAQITKEIEPEEDKEKLPPYRRPAQITQPEPPPPVEPSHEAPSEEEEAGKDNPAD